MHAMDEKREKENSSLLNGVIEWLEYEGHSSFLAVTKPARRRPLYSLTNEQNRVGGVCKKW